jgi:23S rRNA pseudouridine1911/1915/1917 synthase
VPRIELRITHEDDGARLDRIVIRSVGGTLGRAAARDLFARGGVRVGGRAARKGARARAGDLVTIDAAEPGPPGALPEPGAALDMRLERADIVVVSKPPGQPSAPLRAGELGCLANALVARYPEMAGVGYSPREPGLVHRLDTQTSGLLVAARSHESFERVLAALRAGRIDKRYLLVCRSDGLASSGSIEFAIAPHPRDSRRVVPCLRDEDARGRKARTAVTSFRVVERRGAWALVEARVARAVRHQVRAHFAAIGHPLAGDALYGGDSALIARQALHACHLSCAGDSLESFEVRDELPADMRGLLEAAARG